MKLKWKEFEWTDPLSFPVGTKIKLTDSGYWKVLQNQVFYYRGPKINTQCAWLEPVSSSLYTKLLNHKEDTFTLRRNETEKWFAISLRSAFEVVLPNNIPDGIDKLTLL
jgi:hypothetical protein